MGQAFKIVALLFLSCIANADEALSVDDLQKSMAQAKHEHTIALMVFEKNFVWRNTALLQLCDKQNLSNLVAPNINSASDMVEEAARQLRTDNEDYDALFNSLDPEERLQHILSAVSQIQGIKMGFLFGVGISNSIQPRSNLCLEAIEEAEQYLNRKNN